MKRQLLFISPVVPSATGLGRQIRAWQWLQQLAPDHVITLVVADRHPLPAAVEAFVERCIVLPLPSLRERGLAKLWWWLPWIAGPRAPGPPLALSAIPPALPVVDRVFVFRLYMLPVAQWLLGSAPQALIWLDLDDWESKTARRLQALARIRGWRFAAWKYGRDARLAERAESRLLPTLQRVFVCSEPDRTALAEALPGVPVERLPNRYCGPLEQLPQRQSGRLLFVGSMGYTPNQDGVLWFAEAILPLIRRQCGRPLRLHVVGPMMPNWLTARLRALPDVVLDGYVEDLTSAYGEAELVVCPVRAGGGTRIKILEAVAMGRAVVTTSVGREGLDFAADEMAVADDAESFANAVTALLDDPERRLRLVQRAEVRLQRHYWLPPPMI